jgi:PKD repeat protein
MSVAPGESVQFEDLSVNHPTSWQWFFPGGSPEVSTLQHPSVIYTQPGCHDVTLIATNAAGNNAVTKPCYIDVLTTAVHDPGEVFTGFIVFPNPVTDGRVNVEFSLDQPAELDFAVVDEHGMLVKQLMRRQVKEGLNNLSFNTDPLGAGIYSVVVADADHRIVRSTQFIVPR